MPGGTMKLFCDEMLGRLGHWLRAAGYDTAIAEGGMADAEIVAHCLTENRILVTRDRHLEERVQGGVPVVRLSENRVEDQARSLKRGARYRLAMRPVQSLHDRQCAPRPGPAG